MLKIDNDGLARELDGTLVAHNVDSFKMALGVGMQSDTVIFRLYSSLNDNDEGALVHEHKAHQFALSARRANVLAQSLLEFLAQIEKDKSNVPDH